MADPNFEVCPDFASAVYDNLRNTLAGATQQTQEQVIALLTDTWTEDHNQRIAAWDQQREAEAQAAAEANRVQRELDEQARLRQEQETENERREAKKKKPKINDFDENASISDVITLRPAQYALQKIAAFEFVEMWYFSPDGCADAARNTKTSAEEAFGLTKLDDHVALRPLASFRASRNVLDDHEIPFAQLLQAKNTYLVHLQKAGWPDKHVNSIATLYWNIENHPYRTRPHRERVLSLYASRARREWHDELKRNKGFNIASINEMLLRTINDEVWDSIRADSMRRVEDYVNPSHRGSSRAAYREPNFTQRHTARHASPQQQRADDHNRSRHARHTSGHQDFRPSAGSQGRSACALCLGRFPHDVHNCKASQLWDGMTAAYCRRGTDGRLVNPKGTPLCFDWQRLFGCSSPYHDQRHECSGCREKNHGAQACPRGEKA
ncbi:hypothetical protein BV22DRAFT_1042090 [Leucogyrophana mollusca]|uniref:Uncharacterized protein n=1 Tax=Leucogyrophana mollusca TaxID=85980 RepID=A0ACB8AX44_9AGAM|nr:hypothetical protein BV22DRAFT_1042090 [Leucogyrophana mollusca]